ncbi:9618_t:CDS:2 [Racocetra fulgida]|uniref:9618_t:CDS:1 n=1 Tax=Racocetra fulgida TaxID=60492 RepID=A0A9N9FW37_9GLOM|nr:9618_t:CDS:2 [Racocetra fulgida]
MTKIATSFVNHYKLTSQISLPQLSSYIEKLASKLLNSKTKEQAQKASIRLKDASKNPIKIIAQNIIKNLSPKKINEIAYNLASSAPTTVAENSQLNLL